MTFPGTSTTEWTVACGRGLATAEEARGENRLATYLKVFRIFEGLPQLLKPLLPGLLWYTEGSGESDPTMILV